MPAAKSGLTLHKILLDAGERKALLTRKRTDGLGGLQEQNEIILKKYRELLH